MSKIGVLVAVALAWAIIPFVGPSSTSLDDHHPADMLDVESVRAITNLDQLQAAALRAKVDSGKPQADIALAITKIVERRFVHGIARQSWRANWIANLLDESQWFKGSFSGAMAPNDILEHHVAFCSQVSLVVQAMFERNGITYASFDFNRGGDPPHSSMAGFVDGEWRFYDASMEPLVQGELVSRITSGRRVSELYAEPSWGHVSAPIFQKLVDEGHAGIGRKNGGEPWRGLMFQKFTSLLSRWGWILPLLLALTVWFRDYPDADQRTSQHRNWLTIWLSTLELGYR